MSQPPPPQPPFQPEPEEFTIDTRSRTVGHYSPRSAPARSAGLAAVLSFVIPGAGQLYNGQIGKGLMFLVLFFITLMLCFILIGIPLLYLVAGWSIYDAAALPEYPQPRHGRNY